jgi:hypothetical protein
VPGDTEKIDGFRGLGRFARAIKKQFDVTARFDDVIAHENAVSRELDGRSVFDKPERARSPVGQLSLF